jgi:hypothetical protein
MSFLGFLARKLDGLISLSSPLLLRTLGIVWLGLLWMIFGSSLRWGASVLFLSGVPFLGLVIVNKMFPLVVPRLPAKIISRLGEPRLGLLPRPGAGGGEWQHY